MKAYSLSQKFRSHFMSDREVLLLPTCHTADALKLNNCHSVSGISSRKISEIPLGGQTIGLVMYTLASKLLTKTAHDNTIRIIRSHIFKRQVICRMA